MKPERSIRGREKGCFEYIYNIGGRAKRGFFTPIPRIGGEGASRWGAPSHKLGRLWDSPSHKRPS